MRWIGASLLLAASLAGAAAATISDADLDPATGYRIARYQAPVPDHVPGGTRVQFEDVARFVKEKTAILIDVMATDGAGVDPETGRWTLLRPRRNIPGSHWLADVGRGRLDAGLEHYFKSNLERLTDGDRRRSIVIYCLADCWMGWNAAKRAASYGYASIHWYPEGSDGWRDWDGTLANAEPVPMEPADAKLHQTMNTRKATSP